MATLLYNISQVLGITLIHSLWQALLIYFMLRIVLTVGSKLSAAVKYQLAVTSLLAITGWFVFTLIREINVYNWLAAKPIDLANLPAVLNLPAGISEFKDQSIRYYYDIEGYLPYIAVAYFLGLLFNTGKLVLARKKINLIKRTMSIELSLQYQVRWLAGVLKIASDIKIGISKLVDVPCMVGYLKPVILLPFNVTNYLAAAEIEAILLHELAHVKRHDYLVNLLQQIIGILLFFNPCTLLINRIINEERENCCDDLVVKATADPIIYAKALLKLEQNRQSDWQLALAATGKKYHLLNRIERIMKTKTTNTSLRPALLASLILAIGISCMALLKPEVAEGKISVKNLSPVINALLSDTTHKKQAPVKKVHHAAVHKSPSTLTDAENDKKMEQLNAEVQKYSDLVSKHYSDPEYKKMEQDIEELSKSIQGLSQSPDVQRQQEELTKLSEDFSKNYSENDETRGLEKKLGDMGKDVSAYCNTPEFKRMDAELRKKYRIPADHYYDRDEDDQNYKNYQKELESKFPPKIKSEISEMKQMGEEIGKRYETPEYKQESRRMQELGDSIGKVYQSPDMVQKQQEIERLSAKMSDWQNTPDAKKALADLNTAVSKLTAYMRSSEYKNYMQLMLNMNLNLDEQMKNMNFNYNFNLNNDDEKPEKAEKAEKAEKVEKAEKPEKAEKAEKADDDN